ncbi:MAG: hypothetical protein K2X43_18855 [Hyphomonadaceae bacterium]|jgi:hypothetical protein|nr:hypothetical protein [Hyphomonadaceae bacterium]
MADGSRTLETETEANAAAAEAAREAKAEVLARAVTVESATSLPRTAKPAKGRAKAQWSEFTVDVWITPFNSVEFGIYKHSRNRAKSRQFTTDMDIFAEVTQNGERTGLLGYREDLWRKNSGMDKRLVFKLFNETVNWRATMDLMIGRSLQLTLGARGLPVTCFSVNVGDHDSVVYLERSANKWPFLPENFSFFLLEDGKPRFYRLRRDLIDLGGDYTLYNHHNQNIGMLDGKVFSIGGKWYGRVKSEHADPRLLIVLKLFCGMLIFNDEARRHMRALARDVATGKYTPKLEKQEADLYMNPRRVR